MNDSITFELDALRLFSSYFTMISGPVVGVLYLITLLPIVRYPKRYKNAFYYFILVVGIADIYNLFADAVFTSVCYLRFECPGPRWLSRLDATLVYYTFHVTVIMQLIIASNRLSAVSAKERHDVIFSRRNAIILIVLAAILAAIETIPGFIYGVEINPHKMTIWFIIVPSFVEQWLEVEIGVVFAIIIAVIAIYTAAYVTLRKHMITDAHVDKRRRMLYQGILIALPLLFLQCTYTIVAKFTIPWVAWIYVVIVGTYFSINPFVYLTFNKRLREDAFAVFPKSFRNMLGERSAAQESTHSNRLTNEAGRVGDNWH